MTTTSNLTEAQKAQFFDQGYLMVPNIFPPGELESLRQEIGDIVARKAEELYAEGTISNTRADEPFNSRLTRLIEDHPDLAPDYFRAIEGTAGGGHRGPAMFGVMTHPRLLDLMEDILGPEIIGSSVYRIRPKIPNHGKGVVPWHQDSGYFEPHCDHEMIVTVWVPLVDATPENGCLQVLPLKHKEANVVTHHTGGNADFLVIEDEDLPLPADKAVTVPVPLGGVLLMTNLTPHCSTPNTTDVIRWSVDLRYQAVGAPTNAYQMPEEYDPNAPLVNIACYRPEGDFVVRSRAHPETVHTYEQYEERRRVYDLSSLPYPDRQWQPVGTH